MFPLVWIKDRESDVLSEKLPEWAVFGLGAGEGAKIERRTFAPDAPRPFAWSAWRAGSMTGGEHGEFPCVQRFEGQAKTLEEAKVRARWALVGLGVLGKGVEVVDAIVPAPKAPEPEAPRKRQPYERPRAVPEINPDNGHGAADAFPGTDDPSPEFKPARE